MKSKFLNINISILFLLIVQSCQEYRKRDLSDKISFIEQICENDSADFFIQHIELLDVERNPNIWIENSPSINLHILIKNKLTKDLFMNSSFEFVKSNFVGIIRDSKDTIYFRNDFLRGFFIPYGDTLIDVNSVFPFWFDYDEGGDNTGIMLSFLKQMDFYYIPLFENRLDTNTYYLHNMYCLGLSPKTKISSYSQIRVK